MVSATRQLGAVTERAEERAEQLPDRSGTLASMCSRICRILSVLKDVCPALDATHYQGSRDRTKTKFFISVRPD